MRAIARTALSMTGFFVFLETLLFQAKAFTIYEPFEAIPSSPFGFVLAFIVVIIAWEALIDLISAHFENLAGRLTVACSIAPPLIGVLVSLLVFFSALPDGSELVPTVPLVLTVCLGISAISQIRLFTWSNTFDSQSLFLASGLSVIACALFTQLILTLAPNILFVASVSSLMTFAGIVLTKARKTRDDGRKESGPVRGIASAQRAEKTDEDPKTTIPAIAVPMILQGLLCASSLGISWGNNLIYGVSTPLFLATLVAGVVFLSATYAYWKRKMDVNALVFCGTLPLALPIVTSVVQGLIPDEAGLMLAMLSQLLLLVFAWTSAIMLSRMSPKTEAIGTVFIVAFMVCFGCFMLLGRTLQAGVEERIMTLAALSFLLYLTWFFSVGLGKRVRTAEDAETVDGENDDMQTGQIDGLLLKRCNALAAQHSLSLRETELLPLIAAGLSAAVIASRVLIATGTVKTHRHRIYGKLGIHSREELVELLNLL